MKIQNPGVADGSISKAKLAADVAGQEVFLVDGNFTAPHAGDYLIVAKAGGGGGGGGANLPAFAINRAGLGGNGGGEGELIFQEVTLTDAQVVAATVGPGGAGGAAQTDGVAGSNTTFAALVTALAGLIGRGALMTSTVFAPAGSGPGDNGHGPGGGQGGTARSTSGNGNPGAAAPANSGSGGGGGGGSFDLATNTVRTGGAGAAGGSGFLVVIW